MIRVERDRVELVRAGGREEVFDSKVTPRQREEITFRDFVAAIRDDGDPTITAEDGREAVRVALAALESAERKGPVFIRRP